MTRTPYKDYLNKIPFGLGMGGQDLREYGHPVLASIYDKLATYNDTKPVDTNYMNNWTVKKDWDYANGVPNKDYAQKAAINIMQAQPPQSPMQAVSQRAVQALPPPPKPQPNLNNVIEQANAGNFEQSLTMAKDYPDLTPVQQVNTGNFASVGNQAFVSQDDYLNRYTPNEELNNRLRAEQQQPQAPQVDEYENYLAMAQHNEYYRQMAKASYNRDFSKVDDYARQLAEYRMNKTKQAQVGQLTPLDKAKLDTEIQLQELKNKGTRDVADTQQFGDWIVNTGKGLAFNQATGEIKSVGQSGKMLTEKTAKGIGESVDSIDGFYAIKNQVASLKNKFGVIQGRLNQLNPWDIEAQSLKASLEKEAYALWRQIDPRLSDQDAVRALRQIGDLGNPPEYTLNRLDYLIKKAESATYSKIKALQASGYDTNGVETMFTDNGNSSQLNIPQGAIQKLLSNPSLAGDFDAKYTGLTAPTNLQQQHDMSAIEAELRKRGAI